MDYKIDDGVMQSLTVRLQQGEVIYTESGGMAWMTDGIDMKTSGRGGIGKMLGRALSGESLFMTTYTAEADNVIVTFTQETMGSIIPLKLEAGQSMILQRDAFMCAEDDVNMEMHFRKKLGTGLFGGEGFILQKITGPGIAFGEIFGAAVEYDLQAGQRLKIDPGHIAMFEPSVSYDIAMVKGVSNILLGGEGLFLATLTGPGKVWLQTIPLRNLAMKIYSYLPPNPFGDNDNNSSGDIGSDIIGGIAKNLLG